MLILYIGYLNIKLHGFGGKSGIYNKTPINNLTLSKINNKLFNNSSKDAGFKHWFYDVVSELAKDNQIYVEYDKSDSSLTTKIPFYDGINKSFINLFKKCNLQTLLTFESNENYPSKHWYKSLMSDFLNIYYIKQQLTISKIKCGCIHISYTSQRSPSKHLNNFPKISNLNVDNDVKIYMKYFIKTYMNENGYYYCFNIMTETKTLYDEPRMMKINLADNNTLIFLQLYLFHHTQIGSTNTTHPRDYTGMFLKCLDKIGCKLDYTSNKLKIIDKKIDNVKNDPVESVINIRHTNFKDESKSYEYTDISYDFKKLHSIKTTFNTTNKDLNDIFNDDNKSMYNNLCVYPDAVAFLV